jgi:hypothetical protein
MLPQKLADSTSRAQSVLTILELAMARDAVGQRSCKAEHFVAVDAAIWDSGPARFRDFSTAFHRPGADRGRRGYPKLILLRT